jgi:hypothetical protein
MPLLAYGLFLLEDSIHLPPIHRRVAAGAIIPPGHIQNEKTPFPLRPVASYRSWCGKYSLHYIRNDIDLSGNDCGCSTLTQCRF